MASNWSELDLRMNRGTSSRGMLRAAAALVVGLLGTTLLFSPAARAADDADNSAGQAPYKTKCLACHGADGSGTPVGKSLKAADLRSPEVQKKSDAELAQYISDGKGNMPSFKSSTKDDEIQALVKYVRGLGGNKKTP
jgi:cytochrome c6